MAKLNFVKVKSSQIKEVAHDPEHSILYVRFKSSDKLYSYKPVSDDEYVELLESGSVGSYFHKNIKGRLVEPKKSI